MKKIIKNEGNKKDKNTKTLQHEIDEPQLIYKCLQKNYKK